MPKYLLSALLIFSGFSASHADIFHVTLDQEANASGVQHWDDSNFDSAISQSGVVVVDFYAEWCPPCRKFGPTFEAVAQELEGAALFGKVNVDQGRKVSGEHRVTSIPTVVIFKNGKEVKRQQGGTDVATFRAFVESVL
jgi:thioredoxin 1